MSKLNIYTVKQKSIKNIIPSLFLLLYTFRSINIEMPEFPNIIKFWTFSFQKSQRRGIENGRKSKATGSYE